MERIKRLGWLGVILALIVFSIGFCAGAVYRNGAAPSAHSALPKHDVTEVTVLQPPISAADITKLAEAVSGIREQLTEMNAALARIEAGMRKR